MSSFPREEWARLTADPEFAPPGGESTVDVAQRMHAVVDELAHRLETADTVILVSHGGALRIEAANLLGVSEERLRKLDNARWGELVSGASGWVLEGWNR